MHPRQVNCGNFRHGAHRKTLRPLGPHTAKYEIDRLVKANAIVGCGQPFRITRPRAPGGQPSVAKCGFV